MAVFVVLLLLATGWNLLQLLSLSPVATAGEIVWQAIQFAMVLGFLIAATLLAVARLVHHRRHQPEQASIGAPLDDFQPAVAELRKLARRQEDGAREPLLAIAKHLAALSRADLPIEETRTERHLARSLAEAAAGLRLRGADLEPDALQPLMEIAAELEAAHAASRDRKSRDFTLTTQALQQQASSRSRRTF
jgi:hypothetical protein